MELVGEGGDRMKGAKTGISAARFFRFFVLSFVWVFLTPVPKKIDPLK